MPRVRVFPGSGAWAKLVGLGGGMDTQIGIVGYGRFGRSLAALASEAKMTVTALDPRTEPPRSVRAASADELAGRASLIVLAVPVAALSSALAEIRPRLGPGHLVMDVCSVKLGPTATLAELAGREVPWVGTHPLFGPTSLASAERPLRAVVCPNAMHPEAAARAAAFYERLGAEVLLQDADAHDRAMAETHALAFFVAKGMIAAGATLQNPFAPPSAHAMARIVESVRSDAEHLFETIERGNPHAAEARRRLLAALGQVDRDLAAPAHEEATPALPPQAGNSPGPQFDLVETRRMIDQVDRELVGLLARRAQLAQRAAGAKRRLDLGIRDEAREAALLRSRNRWAVALGVDPSGVDDVFRAILRASRRLQRQSGSKRVPRKRSRP